MNVETLERSYNDASQTFFDEFELFKIVLKLIDLPKKNAEMVEIDST